MTATILHSGISKTYTPDPSVSSGPRVNEISSQTCWIRVTIEISGTNAAPTYGGLWIPSIWKNTEIHFPKIQKFQWVQCCRSWKILQCSKCTAILTKVFGDELYNSSSKDLYMSCRANLMTESINIMAPLFVNHGLSSVEALNKSARIWIPATKTRRMTDVTHWSAADHILGQGSAVWDAVGNKSDYSKENYKTDFEIWKENYNFKCEHKNIERNQPPWY